MWLMVHGPKNSVMICLHSFAADVLSAVDLAATMSWQVSCKQSQLTFIPRYSSIIGPYFIFKQPDFTQ